MSATPPAGNTVTQPFTLKPDGRVSTNWQTLVAVVAGTAVIVGGLFSVKADIATAMTTARTAADDAKQALTITRDIKQELMMLRWQISNDTVPSTASPSGKPTTRNQP